MNVTHVSTFDIEGGAARAAFRLHKGLQGLGVGSGMLVQQKTGHDPGVTGPQGIEGVLRNKLGTYLDLLPLKLFSRGRKDAWGLSWLPSPVTGRLARLSSDIIHLHWVGCGFLPLSALPSLKRPIVWTFHDSWPFTGGCILPGDCLRYREACGACPQLGSTSPYDLSRWELERKARFWKDLDLTIVAPSRWIAECAGASSLFRDTRIEVIGHGMDLERFKPMDRCQARDLLGLPRDRPLVLFGATHLGDHNKGFHLLREALQRTEVPGGLMLFGSSAGAELPDAPVPLHALGRLHDDISLSVAYSAADVMCVPSLQESFGQAASEAMACGTPVVAFGATGLLDIVDHRQNGYRAAPFDTQDLARGIDWVLSDPDRHARLCRAAREKAEAEFDMKKVAERYLGLYNDILGSRRAAAV